MEFSVLASSKAFWRGSSFCSLRWAKLQHEDPIDFNVLASNKAFWRRSSFCSLRRVKLQNEDLIDFIVLASKKAFQHISFNWFPNLRSSVFGLRSSVDKFTKRGRDTRSQNEEGPPLLSLQGTSVRFRHNLPHWSISEGLIRWCLSVIMKFTYSFFCW